MSRVLAWLTSRPYFTLWGPIDPETGHPSVYMRRFWLLGAGTARDLDQDGQSPNPPANRLTEWLSQWIVIRLHNTLMSDPAPHLHDHPAWNLSIVLKGGYWELLPDRDGLLEPFRHLAIFHRELVQHRHLRTAERTVAMWRGPGCVVYRAATARHRLILQAGKPSWSIWMRGRTTQKFGFYVDGVKVSPEEYEGRKLAAIEPPRHPYPANLVSPQVPT